MQKRGQVTIFVILGIFIVILVGVIYYLINYSEISKIKREGEARIVTASQVKFAFDQFYDCLNQISLDGFYYVTNHGGYYDVPKERSFSVYVSSFLIDFIPYYYLDKEKLIPDLSLVSGEISNAVKDGIGVCSDLEIIKLYKINVSKNYNVSTIIKDNVTTISIKQPISFKRGSLNIKEEDFVININSNLNKILSFSNNIIDLYAEQPGYLCLQCFQDLAIQDNLALDIINSKEVFYSGDDVFWFIITDKNYKIQNKNFTWSFMVENEI